MITESTISTAVTTATISSTGTNPATTSNLTTEATNVTSPYYAAVMVIQQKMDTSKDALC